MQACGLERFALLGMTGGGPSAVTYAVRHPERVTHLVLYGTFLRGRIARSTTPEQMEETETPTAPDRARLGPRRHGLPAGLHHAVHPRGHARAVQDLQRAAAPLGVAGQRACAAARAAPAGHHRAGAAGALPHAGLALRATTPACRSSRAARWPRRSPARASSRSPAATTCCWSRRRAWAHAAGRARRVPAARRSRRAQRPRRAAACRRAHRARAPGARTGGAGHRQPAHRGHLAPEREDGAQQRVDAAVDKLGVHTRAAAIVAARDAGFGRRTGRAGQLTRRPAEIEPAVPPRAGRAPHDGRRPRSEQWRASLAGELTCDATLAAGSG